MARPKTLLADPGPDGLARLRAALALDDAYGLDGTLGDVLLTVPADRAGALRLDGRRLPPGPRALLGGEVLCHGRRRVRLLARSRALADAGTRTLARAALARGFFGDVVPGPCLAVLDGPAAGRRWPLSPGLHRLGRGLAADIVVVDPTVSRRHAEVAVGADGAVRLRDLGSRNGVRVGRRRRRGWQRLSGGEDLRVGRTRLRYLAAVAPDPPGGRADPLWLAAAALVIGGALVALAAAI